MALIVQLSYSQVLYPKKTINPANGDTVWMVTPDWVFGLADTTTKLVDAYNECSLVRRFKDSLLTAANLHIIKQEVTITKYKELKPIYESLVIKHHEIDSLYQVKVVLVEEKLAIHKKKNVARWVTIVGLILLVGGGAFLVGYFVGK